MQLGSLLAHGAFLILGAYGVYLLGQYGVDPLLAGALLIPVFFVVGLWYFRRSEPRFADTI